MYHHVYKFYIKDIFSTRILYFAQIISLVWRAIAKSFWLFPRMHYIMYKYLLHLDDNNVDNNNVATVAVAIVLVQIVSHQLMRKVSRKRAWLVFGCNWLNARVQSVDNYCSQKKNPSPIDLVKNKWCYSFGLSSFYSTCVFNLYNAQNCYMYGYYY